MSLSPAVDPDVEFHGYALKDPNGKFEPWSYHPRKLHEEECEIEISHCGICASDLHLAFGGWGSVEYPVLVGHEIVGKVTKVGSKVTEHKVGDRVGQGAQAFACMSKDKAVCKACATGNEEHCSFFIGTYGGRYPDGERSRGGYCSHVRTSQWLLFQLPTEISSAHAGPLMCAGATVFSPLRRYGAGPGKKVGIIGIGGLGHLGVQFAAKMGAETWAIGTSASKAPLAKKLGAVGYLNLADKDEFTKHKVTFDLIVCTANADDMDWDLYLSLCTNLNGVFALVALPNKKIQFGPFSLVHDRVQFVGSNIGSRQGITDMLDFCAKTGVRPMVEELPMSEVNQGIQKVKTNDVKFRVVLKN